MDIYHEDVIFNSEIKDIVKVMILKLEVILSLNLYTKNLIGLSLLNINALIKIMKRIH